MYNENIKTYAYTYKEEASKIERIPRLPLCSFIGRNIIEKLAILSKTLYRFNMIFIKYNYFFSQKLKNRLKVCVETNEQKDSG